MSYTHVPQLDAAIELPADGTLSRTLLSDHRIKVVLFAFSAGQELSEHTATMPAVIHFLEGEARVTLGGDSVDAKAGTWIHMPALLPHSILTKTPVKMLLTLLKTGDTKPH
jgi:quercetin dioxygenase-like cupin family protein